MIICVTINRYVYDNAVMKMKYFLQQYIIFRYFVLLLSSFKNIQDNILQKNKMVRLDEMEMKEQDIFKME